MKTLFEELTSEDNIYKAIYALDSYIHEKELLSADDLEIYYRLKDKYDYGFIKEIISLCVEQIKKLLTDPDFLLPVSVFFKLKKYEDGHINFRPMHTGKLIDQICMASLMLPLMFDDSSGKRKLSELSKMIPANFFGNIPSLNPSTFFIPWQKKYSQYAETVLDKCRRYKKSRKYENEVSLDLKDFFPSINPHYIFNFIWSKLSPLYKQEDRRTLCTSIIKLLYFQIERSNINGWEDIYYPISKKISEEFDFAMNRGIPQGLPQSYFFGNLCMIEVNRIINKEFRGESFFYVDDSVIYTNEDLTSTLFQETIKRLNENVGGIQSLSIDISDANLNQKYVDFQNNITYKILFHSDEKSTYCRIENSFDGLGGIQFFGREGSMIAGLRGNLDEVDDRISRKKLEALEKAVNAEIKKMKDTDENSSSQDIWKDARLKWLRRYKRFFIFRHRLLRIKEDGEITEEYLKNLKERYKFEFTTLHAQELEKIFSTFEEEIFKAEIEIVLTNSSLAKTEEFQQEIIKYETRIATFDNPNHNHHLYYMRDTEGTLVQKSLEFDEYSALRHIIRTNYRGESNLRSKVWEKKLREFIEKQLESQDDCFEMLFHGETWAEFIFRNDPNFIRRIINTYFSEICSIATNDTLAIVRNNIRPISYMELRLLMKLRNRDFTLDEFTKFLNQIDFNDLNESMSIDMGLLEVLGIFRQRVRCSNQIDILIQTHRLIRSLWHNGSKFLNAYTLHNQEHAVKLIKNALHLINAIDYLNLKSIDYYLLFMACYLHDISMVIHPEIDSFAELDDNSEQIVTKLFTNIRNIFSVWSEVISKEDFDEDKVFNVRQKIAKHFIECFSSIFYYFESKVRDTHTWASAALIRKWNDSLLSFATPSDLNMIAEVSESHGWKEYEVYGRKSSAKNELISLKYMMILIRLADLLDLANDRVDYNLLQQNSSQMSNISRYHWISHLITENVEVDANYIVDESKGLSNRPITEKLNFNIQVNIEFLASIGKVNMQCKGFTMEQGDLNEVYSPEIPPKESKCFSFGIIERNIDCKKRKEGNCPFLCIWMREKHGWLLNELIALRDYLNSTNIDLFTTEINLNILHRNEFELGKEFYDCVNDFLSDKISRK